MTWEPLRDGTYEVFLLCEARDGRRSLESEFVRARDREHFYAQARERVRARYHAGVEVLRAIVAAEVVELPSCMWLAELRREAEPLEEARERRELGRLLAKYGPEGAR